MKHALVVDNNEFYRTVLSDFLREEGYQVRQAADGLGAMRAIAAQPPGLILLDLIMPKVDGGKVCRWLRADPRYSAVRVVVLSGILVEDIENQQAIGADAFVAKMPLERLLPVLRETVRRLEEGHEGPIIEGFEGLYRREIVSELMEEKRFRDHLLCSLAEGAAELGADRRILSMNPAFASLIGWPEVELMDRQVEEVLGLEPAALPAVFGSETAGSGQAEFPLGEKFLSLRASRVTHGGETVGFLALLQDVTAAAAAAREKEILQARLTRTEKLSSLGRMVAGLAHHLNNPLTGVLGFAQLLLHRSGTEEIHRDLQRIQDQAERCQRIVENLLAFSRRVGGTRAPTSLATSLEECVQRRRTELDAAGIQVVLEMEPDVPEILLDRERWEESVDHLLSNACRAMRQGGAPGRLRITARRAGEYARVEVHDNGRGIATEDLPRVFDPFFTTAEVGEGAGLGLSVVYGVVREHQGRVSVASRPGEGATFTLDLPLSPGERQEHALQPVHGRRVLVVDDEPVILDLLADLLDGKGVEVQTALNGVEALEKLQDQGFDAVILDLKMPRMGGQQVYETLRQSAPDLASRVVFSTGDTVSAESRAFLERSAAPVLQKPFRLDHVLEVLGPFLTGQSAAVGVA